MTQDADPLFRDDAGAWAELMAARRAGRRMRAAISPLIGVSICWLTGEWWLLAWVGLIVAVIGLDERIFADRARRILKGARPDTPGQLAWTTFQASLWVLPVWTLWGVQPYGAALCYVFLTSTALQTAVSLRMAPRLLIAGSAPMLLGMAVAPLLHGEQSVSGLVSGLFALALLTFFLASVTLVLRRSDRLRDAALHEARAARAQAEAADRAKADFLLLLSEELRTPAAALASAGRELAGALSPAARVQLGAVLDASEVLSGVLDDVLAAAQAGPDGIASQERETDLGLLLRYAVEAWRGRAQARWIELHLDVQADVPPRIVVDPVRLKQALFALLAFAVEGVRCGGVRVQVCVSRLAARRVEIAIRLTDGAGEQSTLRESAWAQAERAVRALQGRLRREMEADEPVAAVLIFPAELPLELAQHPSEPAAVAAE